MLISLDILIITSISFSRCIRLKMLCCRHQKQHDIQGGRFKSEIMKPKPLVTRLHTFRLSETCECCCWPTGLPLSFVIGQLLYCTWVWSIDAHSRPQRPLLFGQHQESWPTSGKVQYRKSAIHGLPVTLRMLRDKSEKSDWLRIRNDYSAHTPKITFPRSRFLVLTKRSAASGNKNDRCPDPLYHEF